MSFSVDSGGVPSVATVLRLQSYRAVQLDGPEVMSDLAPRQHRDTEHCKQPDEHDQAGVGTGRDHGIDDWGRCGTDGAEIYFTRRDIPLVIGRGDNQDGLIRRDVQNIHLELEAAIAGSDAVQANDLPVFHWDDVAANVNDRRDVFLTPRQDNFPADPERATAVGDKVGEALDDRWLAARD